MADNYFVNIPLPVFCPCGISICSNVSDSKLSWTGISSKLSDLGRSFEPGDDLCNALLCRCYKHFIFNSRQFCITVFLVSLNIIKCITLYLNCKANIVVSGWIFLIRENMYCSLNTANRFGTYQILQIFIFNTYSYNIANFGNFIFKIN